MQRTKVEFLKGFHVLAGDAHSQAASLVIEAGSITGGPENRHKGADQWLYVESGSGEVIVNDRSFAIEPGSLVLISHGDRHEIRNTTKSPLNTISFYVPPAYTASGEELPPGKAE